MENEEPIARLNTPPTSIINSLVENVDSPSNVMSSNIRLPSTSNSNNTSTTETSSPVGISSPVPLPPKFSLNGERLEVEEYESNYLNKGDPNSSVIKGVVEEGESRNLNRSNSSVNSNLSEEVFEEVTLTSTIDETTSNSNKSVISSSSASTSTTPLDSPALPPIPISSSPSTPTTSLPTPPILQSIPIPIKSISTPASPSMQRSNTSSTTGVESSMGTPRRSSVTSTNTISAPGSSSIVSGILIVSALESIAASKEAKKSKPLKEALEKALEALKNPLPPSTSPSSSAIGSSSSGTVDPLIIFTPLRLACETKSLPLMISALDCIGKLVSYDFFIDNQIPGKMVETNEDGEAPPPIEGESIPLADLVTSTVCDCFSPSPSSSSSSSSSTTNTVTTQHDTLLLRLLSCLLSLILSSALAVHQSSLLKAVRTVYNVFLMGRQGTVQTVAQATLGQIVGGVFSRVEVGDSAKELINNLNGNGLNGKRRSSNDSSRMGSKASSKADLGTGTPKIEEETLPELEEDEKVDEGREEKVEAEVSEVKIEEEADSSKPSIESNSTTLNAQDSTTSLGAVPEAPQVQFVSTNDLYVKDAFLVFRALCKLSMKPLGAESEKDIKSHAMRSKMLSLHLLLTILQNHLPMFVDPNVVIHSSTSKERTPFISAIKQYLCLALSRNAVSPVIQVFELSCEIFWRVLSGMRTKLKKEIEVLLTEIFLPILEMRNSTVKQKSILLAVFGRLAMDPQALVDIYLNYDCDRASLDNIYERLLNIVSKLGTTHFPPSTEKAAAAIPSLAASSPFPTTGPTLSEDSKFSDPAFAGQPIENHLKRQSLECLVAVLQSLVSWAARGNAASSINSIPIGSNGQSLGPSDSNLSLNGVKGENLEAGLSETDLVAGGVDSPKRSGNATPELGGGGSDDPSRFENAKLRKTTLMEGVKKFNFKPKRGIAFLIESGFIKSREPKDIARFLLNNDGLDKAQIGEYLGEGEADNIATMHAFVDLMDFTRTPFVDALRQFLQSFRLPGEAQKIDRYMLKFAERYSAGNAGVFANADTAYILAFSVILLNTDAHNPQVKKPMSKPEFIKNNRGIDDGKDLDEKLLSDIYDEINVNEIRMKDEVEAAGPQTSTTGLANAIATVGRDLQREAYVWQSEGMATKTEALFRTMVRGQRRGTGQGEQFHSASHFEHVKPMFEVAWMSILAGISGPLQDSEDIDLITLSLKGFKQAIKIVCLFDLELERNAFVTTLAKFTFLNNLGEMRAKNVEAIKTLLDVAMVDGNYLKGSWREVITCVSQLERFQLIAQGVDSQSVPELGRRTSTVGIDRRSNLSSRSRNSRPTEEVALETRSQHITITADMIFSSTPQLSGTAIVDFVQALSDVSWEEIQASGLAEQPRVFCLQKLVEISYYNMSRIRLEWSTIWRILGEHFNLVTCHTNAKVSFLALDSLRQLAMRFLEKEELANFKFQKDFLKPFEYAMLHNNNPDARDMVLQCLNQMIQARVHNLRSGWRTMFSVFSAASKVSNERIALQAFDLVQGVNKSHFGKIVAYGSFADLTVCITDFCKISKYQRASLQAIEMLKEMIPQMLNCPECPLSSSWVGPKAEVNSVDDPMIRFWFPILFGFYDVIMNGEDLEVRKRALDYLFDTLKKHGQTFPAEFWDMVCKEVLFPIFAVLRSRSDVSRFSTHEDMSVWLSTTMIQALRNLVDLFTFYFDILSRMLDKLLDLLCECICQENDTLARIGTSCLQQLLENNVQKMSPEKWERMVATFVHLFKTTTAYQLFDPSLLALPSDDTPEQSPSPTSGFVPPTPLSPSPSQIEHREGAESISTPTAHADRRRIFRQIIVKCVLQLLLIETTHELLQNSGVYTTIPPAELLKLMASLDESYRFARKFNADKDLRMALWKVGFMRDLPNLLRQESTSAATLVNVLLRMYSDTGSDLVKKRAEVVDVFAPLGLDVLANYVSLNSNTQARNIAAWSPVCAEILQGFCAFEDETFKAQLPKLYPIVTNTLSRDLDPVVRECTRGFFSKVGKLWISE